MHPVQATLLGPYLSSKDLLQREWGLWFAPMHCSSRVQPSASDLQELPVAFHLSEATAWNTGTVTREETPFVTTPAEQWALAAVLPLHSDPSDSLWSYSRMVIRVEATVEAGSVGISVANPGLSDLISKEDIHSNGLRMRRTSFLSRSR